MASNRTFPQAGSTGVAVDPPSMFDYERFDVYRVALEFQGMVPRLFPRKGYAALREQLDRARPRPAPAGKRRCSRISRSFAPGNTRKAPADGDARCDGHDPGGHTHARPPQPAVTLASAGARSARRPPREAPAQWVARSAA
jgi:hypothetical protein